MSPARPAATPAIRPVRLLVLLLLPLLPLLHPLARPGPAHAQGCCTPGAGPLTGLRGGGLPAGTFRAGLFLDAYRLDTTQEGTEEVFPGVDRSSRIRRLVAQLEAGLPGRARILVELPFEERSRDLSIGGVPGGGGVSLDLQASGPGDLTTTLMIELLPRRAIPAPWGVELGAGIKWNTGSTDERDDGFLVPVELQPGTGSIDPLVALAAHRNWTATGIAGSALVRLTQANDVGYQFGREFDMGIAAWWAPVPAASLGLDARWRTAGHDEFLGREAPNSGGRRLLAGPRAGVALAGGRLGLEAAWLLPVYQDLNGTQLAVDAEWNLGVRYPAN